MLVHGIVASDRFPETAFWGRIPESLRKAGLTVFPGQTDSVGSVQGNSLQLGKTIASVLRETQCKRVLLLAHSKGGIDARHYVSTQRENSHVAGLVTVCTPHGGSELADMVVRAFGSNKLLSKNLSKIVGRFFPDRDPDPLAATVDLTTASMTVFNNEFPDFRDTLYQSYHTRMHSSFDDLALSPTYNKILKLAGANDGIVSVTSASSLRQSVEIKGIDGGVSHTEMLDLKRRKISGLEIPDIWIQIARDAMREI